MPRTVANVTEDEVLAWAVATGATFPVMMDRDGSYSTYDRVDSSAPFPLDVLIDQQGVVRYVSTRYEPAVIEALVQELLGG